MCKIPQGILNNFFFVFFFFQTPRNFQCQAKPSLTCIWREKKIEINLLVHGDRTNHKNNNLSPPNEKKCLLLLLLLLLLLRILS
jgi:hypothetical protein